MKFKNLGELKQNENNKEYWQSGEIKVPDFSTDLIINMIRLKQTYF